MSTLTLARSPAAQPLAALKTFLASLGKRLVATANPANTDGASFM